jgi:hypothetical protein
MYGKNQSGATAPQSSEVVEMLKASLSTTPPPTPSKASTTDPDRPPLEVLPTAARLLIEEAETALGIHPAYALAGMIFAAAAAIGATHRVQVKPGSLQSPCFYMAMIGVPNSNKSGGLKFALDPIQERDAANFRKYQADLRNYHEAAQAGTPDPDLPTLEKTLMIDYSREALAAKHLENLRGLAIFKDELSGWFKDFNRYGGGGEEAFWLANWSGSPIVVDRKSQNTIRISNPLISVAGTIQPGPLKALADGPRADNGFTDRILFAWPTIPEKALWNHLRVPEGLSNSYEAAIDRLQDIGFNTVDSELGEGWQPKDTPHIVPFSDGGQKLLFSFFNDVNKSLCDFAETERLSSMHGKFDVHAPRLALVLQMLWYGYQEAGKEVVTEETTKRAILLTQWFRSQSLKVYSYLYDTSPLDGLSSLELKLYKALPEAFRTSDAKFTGKSCSNFSESKIQRLLQDWQKTEIITKNGHGTWGKLY